MHNLYTHISRILKLLGIFSHCLGQHYRCNHHLFLQKVSSSGDESFVESLDNSLFLRSPEREVRDKIRNVALTPTKEVCFMDLTQLDKFMKQLNAVHVCATPGCKGNLVPLHWKRAGLGGAITIAYNCDGCTGQLAQFETSAKYELGSNTEIGMSVLVAFIIAGCTYTTYLKVMKHALGVSTVPWEDFQSALVRMYPVVTALVDSMCSDAKDDMRQMDQSKLGSWSRAVTSADGTWMTRGFHSKNATFSIRNYFNGAILYHKHLCQRGRDHVVKGELYQGTSKSAEGYGARQLFKKAKEEGMNIEVQWQDADSSSSKSVADLFPNAKVMICGGHAGRAHKKQLEKLQKMKKFTVDSIKKYDKNFPSVGDVVCHCSRHKPGCGCLSDKFIERARNNFSFILSNSDSAEELLEGYADWPDMHATSTSGMMEGARFTNSECALVTVVMICRISSVKGRNTAPGTQFPVHSTHWLMKSNATKELKKQSNYSTRQKNVAYLVPFRLHVKRTVENGYGNGILNTVVTGQARNWTANERYGTRTRVRQTANIERARNAIERRALRWAG